MDEQTIKLVKSKKLSPLGPESRLNNLENKLLLRRVAIATPKADIAKSLIAIFGVLMRVFTVPTRNKETPNKNAKRLKKREA